MLCGVGSYIRYYYIHSADAKFCGEGSCFQTYNVEIPLEPNTSNPTLVIQDGRNQNSESLPPPNKRY